MGDEIKWNNDPDPQTVDPKEAERARKRAANTINGLIGIGVVGALLCIPVVLWKCGGKKEQLIASNETPPEPHEIDPTYTPAADGSPKNEADLVMTAQHAIYQRCRHHLGWSEGATLGGTYVFRNDGDPESVNVSVTLRRKDEVARDHVLWYQIEFADGKPTRFHAMKPISAELCGLKGEDMSYPL